MDSYIPTPPPNIMPLRARPSSDDTRKRKAIATPTRHTPPCNTRLTSPPTVVTGTNFVPVSNPYFPSLTPQPNTRSTVAENIALIIAPPPLSRKKKAAPRAFTLSTYELYIPFRAGCLAYNQDVNDNANDDANNDANDDANGDANDDANDDVNDDVNDDANDDANDNANNDANDDANNVDHSAAMVSDHNAFDTKAYSLMRTQFISTRVTRVSSQKQKQEINNDGGVLCSFCDMDISEKIDTEAKSVLTSDTRRLSQGLPHRTPVGGITNPKREQYKESALALVKVPVIAQKAGCTCTLLGGTLSRRMIVFRRQYYPHGMMKYHGRHRGELRPQIQTSTLVWNGLSIKLVEPCWADSARPLENKR
eukprot:scaffold181263_cov62-Attheya_sp.AAC.1